jgi:hypothetical protein
MTGKSRPIFSAAFHPIISSSFLAGKLPTRYLPIDQFSGGIEMQEDFDGGVTPLFSD